MTDFDMPLIIIIILLFTKYSKNPVIVGQTILQIEVLLSIKI